MNDDKSMDSPLRTSEDKARPYAVALAAFQSAYDATEAVRAALEKLGDVAGLVPAREAFNAAPDQSVWAPEDEAISKALVELHDITRAIAGFELGLPLFLFDEHQKMVNVLRKMLAAQRAALEQDKPAEMSAAARDVLSERRRQQEKDGMLLELDDIRHPRDLPLAAASYAISAAGYAPSNGRPPNVWPWITSQWKPSTERRDLEKAGALILAAIERLDRAAEKGGA